MTCSQNENSRLAGTSPMLICQETISHDNDGTLALHLIENGYGQLAASQL